MNHKVLAGTLLLTQTMLTACGALPTYVAYAGDRLDPSREALIRGVEDTSTSLGGLKQVVLLVCVNGQSAEAQGLAQFKYPYDAAVKPGRTYVGALYQGGGGFALASLWLDAVEGHTYQIKYQVAEQRIFFWIEDAASKATAGGALAQEPETQKHGANCDAQLEQARKGLGGIHYIYVPR